MDIFKGLSLLAIAYLYYKIRKLWIIHRKKIDADKIITKVETLEDWFVIIICVVIALIYFLK